jgi:hypothetical protein
MKKSKKKKMMMTTMVMMLMAMKKIMVRVVNSFPLLLLYLEIKGSGRH